jgi:hypothetical protein
MNHKIILPLVALGCVHLASANLVQNGDFSTDDFTDWSVVDPDGDMLVDPGFSFPTPFAAYFGDFTDYGSISQNLSTMVGTTYTLSYLLEDTLNPDDGESFFVQIGSDTPNSLNVGSFSGVQTFTYDFTATGTTTALTFSGIDYDFFYELGDVSVVPLATPTPTPLLTLGFGLAALALRRRKRSK